MSRGKDEETGGLQDYQSDSGSLTVRRNSGLWGNTQVFKFTR